MGEAIKLAQALWSGVEPLKRRTSPSLAAVIGFLFGGVGLVLYFRTSLLDLLVPLAVTIPLSLRFGDIGWFLGAFIACLYGFFRSAESNARRVQRGIDPPSADVVMPA